MTGAGLSEDRLDHSIQQYVCTHVENEFLHLKEADKSSKEKLYISQEKVGKIFFSMWNVCVVYRILQPSTTHKSTVVQ